MTREEIITQANNQFNRYGIFADAMPHHALDIVINVDVDGDWKHDHLAAQQIMEELGCALLGKEMVEESEDDSYHAIHHYIVKQ